MYRLFKGKSKNIFIICILVVSILVVLTGCSSKREGKNPSISEIDEEIKKNVDIFNMKKGDNDKLKKLYDIDCNEVDNFVLYMAPSNIKADEILILKAKDEKDLGAIKDKINKRIESQLDSFKDYIPEEHYLIEKHVLKSKNNYVLFAVSEEAEKIESIFDKSFK